MHIQDILFCVCNEPYGARQIILTTSSGGKMRIKHTIYYGRVCTHNTRTNLKTHI